MIYQTFESDPPVYPGLCGDGEPFMLWDGYNPYLCTPPRIYSYGSFVFNGGGIAVVPSVSPTTSYEIWLFGDLQRIYWPSWGGHVFRLDGTTGEFLGSNEFAYSSGFNSLSGVKQDRSGVIWGMEDGNVYLYKSTGTTFENLPTWYPAGYFGGASSLRFLAPDMLSDTFLTRDSSTPSGSITVYRISTGAFVKHISIGGIPFDANWETGNRAYVHTLDGLLMLIDIEEGKILGLMGFPVPAGVSQYSMGSSRTCYHPVLKRLLVSTATPDAVDGACTTVVKGYRPLPKATALTDPVLLDKPVAGRRIKAIVRAIGDVGEPVVGVTITASIDAAHGVLVSPQQISDGSGYAIFEIDCITSGTITITAQAEVTP